MDWSALGRVLWASAARAQAPRSPVQPHDAAVHRLDDVAARAAGPLSRLTAADRTEVDRRLASLPGPGHRAVLLAAVAAGHRTRTLAALAERLTAVPAGDLPALLDPFRHDLRQRSSTTCGSASLVVARALADPVYASWLLHGFDPRTGRRAGTDLAGRFAAAERVVHARTTAPVLPDGRCQVPWPRALGTPPWAVATELTRIWAPAGDTGATRFRTWLVDPDDEGSRRVAADALAGTVAAGRTAAMFVGDGVSPRHVTLAFGTQGTGLAVYEPGAGRVVPVPRDELVGGRTVLGGWDRLWAVVVPG